MLECEICHSSAVSVWVTVAHYPHYRCRNCRHLFVYPKPCTEVIEAYYRNAAFYSKAETEELRLISEAQTRLRVLSNLAKTYGVKKDLLDVGCASGIFLTQARDCGWDVEGVEPSLALCDKARKKGLHIANGWLEGLITGEQYPVITAWEVIEHALDPVAFLEMLSSHTAPGGLVALSTPLSTGLPALLLRSRFPLICPPEHLSLFSKESMDLLGKRFGLQLLHFRSFSNLKKENLARGLDRFIIGRASPKWMAGAISSCIAAWLQHIPDLIDRLGCGSEMEIVFRKAA